jgi:hypothetical protein
MNENTRKLLNDLKAKGLNVDSIETQLAVNPLLDKASDEILGAGVLRQQEYTRYMNSLRTQEQTLQQKANELASLHSASAAAGDPKVLTEVIDKMEEALIATGEFDEQSIKAIAEQGRSQIGKTAPQVKLEIPNNSVIPQKETPMQIDTSKFVDIDTAQKMGANIVMGNALVNAKMTMALRRAEKLGINVTDDMIEKFHDNWAKGVPQGKSVDSVIDETFGLSAAQKTADDAALEKRIADARAEGEAEGLKKAGVPARNRILPRNHNLFDRTRPEQSVLETPKEGETPANIPKDKDGNIEFYKLRGDRTQRIGAASELFGKVEEQLAGDLTYTGE